MKKSRNKWITMGLLAAVAAGSISAGSAVQAAYQELSPTSVAATSVLPTGSYGTYYAENLLDYNYGTAWVEGVSGNGEGQFVDFFFPAGTRITGGWIVDGYYKNEGIFLKNSAPSSLSFQSGSTVKTLDFSSAASTYDYSYSPKEFYFDEPIVCDGTLRVTINSVRAGWKYTDTCISELHFYGESAGSYGNSEGSSYGNSEGSSYGNSEGASDGGTSTWGAEPAPSHSSYGPDLASVEQQMAQDPYWAEKFSGIAQRVLDKYYPNEISDARVTAENMSDEARAFAFFWYQYFYNDSRIDNSAGIYNSIPEHKITELAEELFGGDNEGMKSILLSKYSDSSFSVPSGAVGFSATGDFGAVGYWYFAQPSDVTVEDGRLIVTGEVMDSYSNPISMGYTAVFDYTGEEALSGWRFAEVTVGNPEAQAVEEQEYNSSYTDSELEQMALDYYERHYGTVPQYSEASENSDGTVTIHLYSIVLDHTATAAWYTVARNGVGQDAIMGDPVDLNN